MAKDNKPQDLFRRLTRLFRSGPVVKRKIKTADTAINVVDRTKSSGTLLFQKSSAPTYATITANAYNLSERLMRYQDFQEMELTPEISAALDIYADETVAQDDTGKVLHVFSDNEKIRELIEDLFYNTLNVEFNLRSWVRNLVKYGDFFLYNDVSPDQGVISAFPVPVNEIEREENYDRDDPMAVRYRWVSLGNRVLENWEITHFRLLGNDMFLPYGSSIIEPARRIWRQLILIEDAMLVYRVVRAPERRVFYIDVANVPPEDVPSYVEEQRKNLRTNQVIDQTTGRVDLRYNPMPVHWNSQVPLLDGRVISIKDLSQELETNPEKEHWVYSVQDKTNKLVPGKVTWCGKNYTAKHLIKVWLDNNSFITVAPEHPFVMRDGSSKRADELKPNDSLMPLYRKLSNKEDNDSIIGYEKTYDPFTNKFVLTHMIERNKSSAGEEIIRLNDLDLQGFRQQYLPGNVRYAAQQLNHKVSQIENLFEQSEDVYCMTVMGPNEENDRHNFALCGLNVGGDHTFDGVFVKNSIDEDYFIPVRGGESGTKIDTLAGGQNTAAVEDVAYIQKKLFAALKVPRAYLGYDEMLSCLVPNTRVPLLDGRTLSIEQIAQERALGIQHWVYSYDKLSGKIVPGKVIQAGPTRPNAELVRVTLDNGVTVDCTPDHKWMTREAVWCEAKDLVKDQSMMPLYRKQVSLNGGNDYEKIYDPGTNEWVWTHRAVFDRALNVAKKCESITEHKNVIHHIDFNRFNNEPTNLIKMGFEHHRAYHAKHLNVIREKTLKLGGYNGLNNGWAKKCKEKVAHLWDINKLITHCINNNNQNKRSLISSYGLSETQLHHLLLENNITYADFSTKYMGGYRLARKGIGGYKITTYRREGSFATKYKDEGLSLNIEVSCKHCNRKFQTSRRVPAKFCNNNCYTIFGRGNRSRLNHKIVSVEKLSERQQTWCISVETYENFAIENSVIISNSKATLAQEDIRFSRTINVIQKTMLAELNKLAIIHLYSHGYENEDLQNFTLRLSNPSTVAQQQKLELWRSRFEIGGAMPIDMGSKAFVRKKIWGLSDDECEDLDLQRLNEKLIDAQIEAATGGADGDTGNGEDIGDDLFGGGDEESAPAKDEEPVSPPGPETAGEEPEEETEPGVSLLTSSDDNDSDESFELDMSLKGTDFPIKPQTQLQKSLYNRSRRRTHGPSKTHMPDFHKMTSTHNSLKDPFDSEWIKSVVSNPLGETTNIPRKIKLSTDMKSTLSRMKASLGFRRSGSQQEVLSESNDHDLQSEIDFEINNEEDQ